jgi:hypothetical protein
MKFSSRYFHTLTTSFSGSRRRGYAAGVATALAVVLIAVSRFAPAVSSAPGSAPGSAPAAQPAADEAGQDVAETAAATAPTPEPGAADESDGLPAAVLAAPFAFPPITDGVARMRTPTAVRGLYLNAWAAGSQARLARLIDTAVRTEINSFVIDVKEGGEISYRSQVPLARAIGADQAYIRDVRGMLRRLRENGIYPIARIVVFRDPVLAQARPDWAVHHVDGGEWIDNYGHYWVDSYNRDVWDYNIAIAREAIELGFAEVQWDYVRFPDVPSSYMRTAHWPAQEGRSKAAAIREFLLYSRAQLRDYGVPVTADVFGLTVSVRNDMGIGQQWEKMVDATDVLLPMVYPSHFARGSYGIAEPNAQPYETVLRAMQHAVNRTRGVANAAGIRPWLQDFTLGQPRYGAEHVRAQIDAVYDAGLTEWILWHPGSNYTVAALAAADGTRPDLQRPLPAAGAPPPAHGPPPAGTGTRRPLGTPLPPPGG